MPSCEYCGCKVSASAREEMPGGGQHVFVCGKPECQDQYSDAVEAEYAALEDDADREMIGEDAAFGLENIGNK